MTSSVGETLGAGNVRLPPGLITGWLLDAHPLGLIAAASNGVEGNWFPFTNSDFYPIFSSHFAVPVKFQCSQVDCTKSLSKYKPMCDASIFNVSMVNQTKSTPITKLSLPVYPFGDYNNS